MRLRTLKFPILIVGADYVEGGGAGLNNLSRFNYDLASNYLDGRYDGASIVDASGKKYRIDEIELHSVPLWRRIMEWAGYLFILPKLDKRPLVSVDMNLTFIEELELPAFCTELQKKLLDHPEWWYSWIKKTDVELLFENPMSFSDVIGEIGYFGVNEDERSSIKAKNVIDLRRT